MPMPMFTLFETLHGFCCCSFRRTRMAPALTPSLPRKLCLICTVLFVAFPEIMACRCFECMQLRQHQEAASLEAAGAAYVHALENH